MMKRGTALLTAALMFLIAAAPAFADVPYPDVAPDHWAYEAIERLHNAGLIEGYPDGTFGGERTFTRYEMAMVFDRILRRYDARMEAALAELGIDVQALTEEFGPELGMIEALAAALADARRTAGEAKDIAEAASGSADTAADRAYRARLAAEQALAEAEKANEAAAMAAALVGGEDGEGITLEEVRLAAQRAQRVAADAEAAALRATAVAEMAFASVDDQLEEAVEATRLAAQRAQRLAADAEAAAMKAQAMAESARTAEEAEIALDELKAAADRAYRARLTAEQALATGRQADEKATQALALSEAAAADVESVKETAQEALDVARQADRLAYLAHLSAERALDTAEGAHGRIDDLEQRVAATPKITASLSADYELAHTDGDPDKHLIDPRGAANGPKVYSKNAMTLGVALGAAVEPREGVRAEGGIKFNRDVFGGEVENVGLSDLYAQVTTDGVLQKAYFGALSGDDLAEGYNAFTLDGDRYGENVAEIHRGGAYVDFQSGRVNTRVIGSLTGKDGEKDAEGIFYGVASNIALEEGLNLGVSYTAKHEEEGHLGLSVSGELEALSYDWAFGRFNDEMSIDGTVDAQVGEISVGFAHRSIADAFKEGEGAYFGKVYTNDDDGIEPGNKDTIITVGAPLFGLDLGYEKGYKATLLDKDYTDWHKVGFSDADIFGFGLSAHYYMDKREVEGAEGNTKAYRVGLDRTVNLGVPVTFSVVHADIAVEDLGTSWAERTHQTFGIAVEDLALSEGLTVGAGYKLERNPLDGDWTDYTKWIVTLKDDNDDEFVIDKRERSTFHVDAELAAGPVTLTGGYELVNQETDKGEVDFSTVDLGADYTFDFLGGDATLGYAWQSHNKDSHNKDGAGFFLNSPRSTYSIGYERAAWGGTVDLGYKYVTGRGDDKANKFDAKDMTAHLEYSYPVADGMDFSLGGKWTSSEGDTEGDYYFSSVHAGFAIKF